MTEAKRKKLLPILITMALSVVLGVGSFFGCASTFMRSGKDNLANFLSAHLCCASRYSWRV